MIEAQKGAGDPLLGEKFEGQLSERERHLIGLAVATTKGCPNCTSMRVEAAKKAGISVKAIKEAINLIAGMNSGFVIRTAVKGCRK